MYWHHTMYWHPTYWHPWYLAPVQPVRVGRGIRALLPDRDRDRDRALLPADDHRAHARHGERRRAVLGQPAVRLDHDRLGAVSVLGAARPDAVANRLSRLRRISAPAIPARVVLKLTADRPETGARDAGPHAVQRLPARNEATCSSPPALAGGEGQLAAFKPFNSSDCPARLRPVKRACVPASWGACGPLACGPQVSRAPASPARCSARGCASAPPSGR